MVDPPMRVAPVALRVYVCSIDVRVGQARTDRDPMTARKTKRSAKKTRPRASTRVSPPPASRKIRIVIADDQPIDSRGLSALLQSVPDFEVVAE